MFVLVFLYDFVMKLVAIESSGTDCNLSYTRF